MTPLQIALERIDNTRNEIENLRAEIQTLEQFVALYKKLAEEQNQAPVNKSNSKTANGVHSSY